MSDLTSSNATCEEAPQTLAQLAGGDFVSPILRDWIGPRGIWADIRLGSIGQIGTIPGLPGGGVGIGAR